MWRIGVQQVTPPLRRILCLGAHCDDIEIGCGGTILKLLTDRPDLQVTWVVFSSDSVRRVEALKSAAAFLSAAYDVRVGEFRDGFLPSSSGELKEQFEELKNQKSPDPGLSTGTVWALPSGGCPAGEVRQKARMAKRSCKQRVVAVLAPQLRMDAKVWGKTPAPRIDPLRPEMISLPLPFSGQTATSPGCAVVIR